MAVVRSLLQALHRRHARVTSGAPALARHRNFVAQLQRRVALPAAARRLPPLTLVMRRARRWALAGPRASARPPSPMATAMRFMIAPLVLPVHRTHTRHTRPDPISRVELRQRTTRTLQRVRERVQQRELRTTTTRIEQRPRSDHRPAWPRLAMVLTRPVMPDSASVPRSRAQHTASDLLPARLPTQPSTTPMAVRADPVTLAAPELARVTDHVLHELDERVRSFRERTGRL